METRPSRRHLWFVALGLTTVYFTTARLGLGLALPPDQKATAIWPPSGIALAALLFFGSRAWPGIWLGAFLANLWDAFDPTRGGSFGAHFVSSGAIAVGSTAQALAGAALVRRFTGPGHPLDRTRDVFRFVGIAFAMCLVAPTFGVTALCASGLVPWPAFLAVWWTWWLGDAVGVLVITPVLLTWVRPVALVPRRPVGAEAVGLFALLLVACVLVFGEWWHTGTRASPLAYLSVPLLVWASVRFGPRGASLTVVAIAVFAVWGTVRGTGPFVRADVYESLLLLDIFLVVAVVTALVLCAVLREREGAEDAVRSSETKFRQLAEAMPQIVWATTADGATGYLNRRWNEYTGLAGTSPNELAQVVHPDDLSRMVIAGEVALRAGTVFQHEFRLRPAVGGAYRWFLARSVPVTGPDGAPAGRLGTSTDIDDLKRAQAELGRQSAELQLILDTVPALIFHKDRNHRLVRVNDEVVRVIGLPREAIEGRTDSELGSPHAAKYRRDEEEIMAGARAVRGLVEPLHTLTGTRWLQTAKLPYRDESGRVTGIVGFSVDITERKLAEEEIRRLNAELERRVAERTAAAEARAAELVCAVEALREQKQLLQTILDGLGEAVLVVDKHGKFVLQNTAFQRLHAGPTEPLIHAELARDHGVYLPDGVTLCPVDRLPIARAIRGESCDNVDLMIVDGAHPEGASISVTGRPILGPNGIEGGVIAIRDVTAARVAEAALRESEERYRLLVEGVTDYAILVLDADGCVASWNAGAERIKGYAANEIIGRHFSIFYPPDDVAAGKTERKLAVAAADGRVNDEGWRVRKDGSRFWANVVVRALRDANGRLRGYAKITRDLTARRATEQALRESEERFRSAFDSAAIGMALVGLDGRWLKVNRSVCELVGYTTEELLALDFQTITHPDDLGADLALVGQVLRGELMNYQMEKRYFHKTGHVVHILLAVSLVRDARDQPLYFISQIQDITERKRAEGRLLASVREKEVMLKEIHHRVKNNLQIISTLLDLQSDGIADPAALAAFRESRGRVRSMALIHERLYRSENLASVEFGTYVRNLAEDLFRAYRADDEAIRLDVSVTVPPVPLDLAIPCGLLVNELISNCLKYAFVGKESGIIAVSLERAGAGTYALTVADDGVGVPVGFDFRHATSFGLQLVNTLAEQLGGDITLESGRGTRFTLRFPSRG